MCGGRNMLVVMNKAQAISIKEKDLVQSWESFCLCIYFYAFGCASSKPRLHPSLPISLSPAEMWVSAAVSLLWWLMLGFGGSTEIVMTQSVIVLTGWSPFIHVICHSLHGWDFSSECPQVNGERLLSDSAAGWYIRICTRHRWYILLFVISSLLSAALESIQLILTFKPTFWVLRNN